MTTDSKKELKDLGIGRKIRALREQKYISLADMAKNTGIQEVLLSQIEADVVAPTVATLLNIAKMLGVGIDFFFTDYQSDLKIEVVRSDQRRVIAAPSHKKNTRLVYSYESLAYQMAEKHMEPFMVEFSLDTHESELVPLSHAGEEFIYILEGKVEFISADKRIRLAQGDSLYFHSKIPHVLRGIGSVKPKAIAVLYPYE